MLSVDGTPLPEVRCIRCATGTKSSECQTTCVPSDKTALLLGKLNCEFTLATYYTQYPLQEIQLQEPVLEFGKKLETTSTEILRLRDIQITGKLDPSKNDYSVSLP